MALRIVLYATALTFMAACARPQSTVMVTSHDLLIRHGTVYDGSGHPPITADIAIDGDAISEIGDLRAQHARHEIDARNLAVAPGFINMLSWATETLLADGRSQS